MNKLIQAVIIGLILFTWIMPFAQLQAADKIYYSVSLASTHVISDSDKAKGYPKFNERNLGFGIESDGIQAGLYHNSLYKTSLYVGRTLPGSEYFGIKYGLVTGYSYPVIPYVAGYIRIYNLEITILPRTPASPITIGYSVRW